MKAQENYGIYDKHGEPWRPNAAGFAFLVFLLLVIGTAIASAVASVLH
jgi:hypothetical protein